MNNNELLQQIGALVNATSIQAVIGACGAWLDNFAGVVKQIDGAASETKCRAYREVARKLADLAAIPDGKRPEAMNGQPIYISENGSTLFIPIPTELTSPIEGGCDCEFCKANPTLTPRWNTLALPAKPKNKGGEHTWTVHFPDKRGLKMYGWKQGSKP